MTVVLPLLRPDRGFSALLCTLLLAVATACGAPATPDGVLDPAAELMQEGMAFLQADNGAAAVPVFRAVLSAHPEHYGAQYQLARALDLAGFPEEARPEWEKAVLMAVEYLDQVSVQLIGERLIRPDTLSLSQRMARGVTYLHFRDEPALAVGEFVAVLGGQPTHYGAHYQLATALDRTGQPDAARAIWTTFLRLATEIGDEANAEVARRRLEQNP